ncbi:MAG: hypothetical protein L0Y36_03125 [Planctomycetales bacterium]|nr:hypothetical protein [Planctomycetales bacterium]
MDDFGPYLTRPAAGFQQAVDLSKFFEKKFGQNLLREGINISVNPVFSAAKAKRKDAMYAGN